MREVPVDPTPRTAPASGGGPMTLLPAPQRLRIDGGGHRLRPGRLIHLAGGEPAALLRIGAAVRDAIAAAGAAWRLTERGGSGPEIGAAVAVDPARASRPQGYLLTVGRERIDRRP